MFYVKALPTINEIELLAMDLSDNIPISMSP